MIANLVKRLRVVQTAVDHHHPDALAVADILERVTIEHEQIGELALLERSQLRVEPEVLRAVDRGTPERLGVRHPALLEHPQFPVSAQPLELTVRAELDETTGIEDLLRPF